VEQNLGGGDEVVTLGDVVVERRAGREQRAIGLQDVDVERVDLSRGAAEAREHAERADAVERGRERGLADAVIDHVAELASGDLLHLRGEVLLAIKDGVVSAVSLRDFRLLLRADGTDDGGAERIAPLGEDEADAAGRGMY